MLRQKSFTGLYNPELLRPLLATKAQGLLPWAFFASCICHMVLVIATATLFKPTPQNRPSSKNSNAIHVTVRQTSVDNIGTPHALDQAKPSPRSLAGSHSSPTTVATAVEAKNIDNATADANQTKPETIQPIALPTGITSIWGPSPTHRLETIQQTMAKAQWHARTQEAYRQLSMLQQTFAQAPRSDQAIRCTIGATVQTCSPKDAHLEQFWGIQLGPLFRIDPTFPIVEMNYAIQGGWYAVVQRPPSSALQAEP